LCDEHGLDADLEADGPGRLFFPVGRGLRLQDRLLLHAVVVGRGWRSALVRRGCPRGRCGRRGVAVRNCTPSWVAASAAPRCATACRQGSRPAWRRCATARRLGRGLGMGNHGVAAWRCAVAARCDLGGLDVCVRWRSGLLGWAVWEANCLAACIFFYLFRTIRLFGYEPTRKMYRNFLNKI
jgi:hypothetical protein